MRTLQDGTEECETFLYRVSTRFGVCNSSKRFGKDETAKAFGYRGVQRVTFLEVPLAVLSLSMNYEIV
jgi:hypothetical protein